MWETEVMAFGMKKMTLKSFRSGENLRPAERGCSLLAAAGLFLAMHCLAEPPSGDYQIDFGSPTLLWDLVGDYRVTLDKDPFQTVELSFHLEVGPHGRVTGWGGFGVDELGQGMHLQAGGRVKVSGLVYSRRNEVHAVLRFELKGEGLANGIISCCWSRLVARVVLDPARLALVGTGRGSVGMTVRRLGLRCFRIASQEFVAALPAGAGGPWSLHLHGIQASGARTNRLSGSACLQLFNGKEYPLEVVRGVYWSRLDDSALVLRASQTNFVSRGISVSLRAGGGAEMNVERVVVRIQGQTVRMVQSPEL
jgi:hypothetical protein